MIHNNNLLSLVIKVDSATAENRPSELRERSTGVRSKNTFRQMTSLDYFGEVRNDGDLKNAQPVTGMTTSMNSRYK